MLNRPIDNIMLVRDLDRRSVDKLSKIIMYAFFIVTLIVFINNPNKTQIPKDTTGINSLPLFERVIIFIVLLFVFRYVPKLFPTTCDYVRGVKLVSVKLDESNLVVRGEYKLKDEVYIHPNDFISIIENSIVIVDNNYDSKSVRLKLTAIPNIESTKNVHVFHTILPFRVNNDSKIMNSKVVIDGSDINVYGDVCKNINDKSIIGLATQIALSIIGFIILVL